MNEALTPLTRYRSGMNDRTRVDWRAWGPQAFVEARERDVPILLSLTAPWCRHCHEMDRETYAVPTIAANVNDGFVPVRVDVDRQPRVRDRYNMGGFPSTVFLAPDGTVLTGAGYLDHDGLRQVLERVREMWDDRGGAAGSVPRQVQATDPPAGELSPTIERQMLGQLTDRYDERAGGWGDQPKFPLPDALEFALKRDRAMATRSFDAVAANLFDRYEGGFFRFALGADWSGTQHEKLLDANAALCRAFANAYLYTGEGTYRNPAERTIEYLTTTLWTGDAFANSQAPGDPEQYTLEPSDREGDQPPVDETFVTGANALAVDALCTYAAYTDDERAARYASRALETIRTHALEDGTLLHGFERVDGEQVPVGEPGLLSTQARTLRALLSARSVLGVDTLEDARAVAETTIDTLRDGASFLDGPTMDVGLLDRPLRPLNANVELAEALLDLAVHTGTDRYERIARETLADFAGASDRFGVQVARYASVSTRVLEGTLVIRIGDEAGSDLHRAACRIADHEKVVLPEASVPAKTAVAQRDGRTTEPATTPAELSDAVQDVLP